MITLNNWSTCTNEKDMDMHPFIRPLRLQGNVAGHSVIRDGQHIVTSRVVDTNGRIITTKSGSVYCLGKIDPKYRNWLRKETKDWDWRNPIKDLRTVVQ